MTRERAKELLPVMEAYVRGEDIEYRYRDRSTHGDAWSNANMTARFGEVEVFEFRIKPKPLEVWGLVERGGVYTYNGTEKSAREMYEYQRQKGNDVRLIKLREVEP